MACFAVGCRAQSGRRGAARADEERQMSDVKRCRFAVDQTSVSPEGQLPAPAGPVPDRLTIWPVDDGRYGLDAAFQGASGYERAEHHDHELVNRGIRHAFKQEMDGGWTLRFGPLSALEVSRALTSFVY